MNNNKIEKICQWDFSSLSIVDDRFMDPSGLQVTVENGQIVHSQIDKRLGGKIDL